MFPTPMIPIRIALISFLPLPTVFGPGMMSGAPLDPRFVDQLVDAVTGTLVPSRKATRPTSFKRRVAQALHIPKEVRGPGRHKPGRECQPNGAVWKLCGRGQSDRPRPRESLEVHSERKLWTACQNTS
jgi:hypothetical protein